MKRKKNLLCLIKIHLYLCDTLTEVFFIWKIYISFFFFFKLLLKLFFPWWFSWIWRRENPKASLKKKKKKKNFKCVYILENVAQETKEKEEREKEGSGKEVNTTRVARQATTPWHELMNISRQNTKGQRYRRCLASWILRFNSILSDFTRDSSFLLQPFVNLPIAFFSFFFSSKLTLQG